LFQLLPTVDTNMTDSQFRRSVPVDQADGLRRLFSGRTMQFVPVISNPHIAFGGVLIERLCSVLDDLGLNTLLVDASERGGAPKELARFDLGDAIEPLSERVSYLAASGLPVRWVDSRGSTRGFLDAVAEAVPHCEVVLVLGTALEMARLFGRGDEGLPAPRPLVLCEDRPDAMTHAYTALKILAQRVGWRAYDLLLCAPPHSQQARTVADRLGHCVDTFLGGVQHAWVQVDPAEPPTAAPSAHLTLLVRQLLAAASTYMLSDSGYAGLRSALPAARLPMMA
jgi:flagellar biosynthesis protein FlhG